MTYWLSYAVLTILLVISGFTLTACKQSEPEAKPTEQLEKNQPAKSGSQEDQKKEDGEDKQADKDGEDKQEDDDPE